MAALNLVTMTTWFIVAHSRFVPYKFCHHVWRTVVVERATVARIDPGGAFSSCLPLSSIVGPQWVTVIKEHYYPTPVYLR